MRDSFVMRPRLLGLEAKLLAENEVNGLGVIF